MMRRLSFTFFPFPAPRQRRLRARDTSIAVISIPPTPRPHRYLVHDATIFIASRLHRFDAFAASRCARATLVVDGYRLARRYLLGGISTTSTHLVRPSVRSRRDATRSPGSMRATTTMTRGRARVDASAPVRATTTRARARARRAVPRAIEQPTREVDATRESERLAVFLSKKGRHASFEATRRAVKRVHESANGRAVREYMALPASQYSTLDGESVERVADDTFKVELSELAFLGLTLKPKLTAKVVVREDGSGCEVRVEDMELTGSGVVENASDAFEIVSLNNVTWRDVEYESLGAKEREVLETCGGEYKEFMSETSVSVYIIVPGWFPFTVKATERTGRFVVKQVVGQVVPRFLNQLAEDYRTWSSGDDSRAATGDGMFECYVPECEVSERR